MQRPARAVRALLAAGVLAAALPAARAAGAAGADGPRVFDVTIRSFDGTPIAMTVFQPRRVPGQPAPLILHSHGWGGSRFHSPEEAAADPLGRALVQAWQQGYYAISFDQRGFGESGGQARVMDPDYEVRDARAVLDWAEAALPGLARRRGDPVVGTLGASYGGGFQLLLAAPDSRVDALVPAVTWYDLVYSLTPHDVVKSAWGTLLTAGGIAGSRGRLDPFIYRAFLEGVLFNRISRELQDVFHAHSLAYFCERGAIRRPVDALLVQGMRDTLFNLNEAYANARCLREAGGDVRLLTIQGGHILPVLQAPAGGLRCGPVGQDPAALVLAWFEEKLRGRRGAARGIPALCLSLDDATARTFPAVEALPVGGQAFPVPPTLLVPAAGTAGAARPPVAAAAATLRPYLDPATATGDGLLAALAGPAFVELLGVDAPTDPVGIPTAQLVVEGLLEETNPVVFVGLGVRRADGDAVEPVDEQVLPLRGFGRHRVDLVGVGTRLAPGDRLGLLLYAVREQFLLNGSRTPLVGVSVRGQVALPLRPAVG